MGNGQKYKEEWMYIGTHSLTLTLTLHLTHSHTPPTHSHPTTHSHSTTLTLTLHPLTPAAAGRWQLCSSHPMGRSAPHGTPQWKAPVPKGLLQLLWQRCPACHWTLTKGRTGGGSRRRGAGDAVHPMGLREEHGGRGHVVQRGRKWTAAQHLSKSTDLFTCVSSCTAGCITDRGVWTYTH